MDAAVSPARQTRARHRHELRTLTYVTVDQANGGIIRDINHKGIGMQVVGAVRPQQLLSLRFELRQPRVRVQSRGEVTWATHSGQCGIRFLDLSPAVARQINEWIFGNLLEEASRHTEQDSIFVRSASAPSLPGYPAQQACEPDDGLMVSAAPVAVIQLPVSSDAVIPTQARAHSIKTAPVDFDWLFQPLTGRRLIWTINTLVVVAALLLFALVFLSITGESPRWPVATAGGAAICVAALYWGFFRILGGASPGTRLARMAGWEIAEDETIDTRFR
jgi:hypothetical protein